MPARLVALDEGPDIPLDRTMIVVGRHPQCDTRLDSLRVSRHHCCMTQDHGELIVRDLGSTNGIRINGQRVEIGRLRAGDELSIAHIRYRLDGNHGHEATVVDNLGSARPEGPVSGGGRLAFGIGIAASPPAHSPLVAASMYEGNGAAALAAGVGGGQGNGVKPFPGEQRLVAAVRRELPSGVADRYKIQVIVQLPKEEVGGPSEDLDACRPDSSH